MKDETVFPDGGQVTRYPDTQRLPTLPNNAITGFILAGGRSLRMGSNKAQISWRNGTLLTRAVEEIKLVTAEVFIVGGAQAMPGVKSLEDGFPGLGPLAGIQAALAHTSTEWNLMVAVDMPLIKANLVRFIAECSMNNNEELDATVPSIAGVMQPLCAMYNRSILPEIDRALQDGQLSIHRLLERSKTRIIEEKELIDRGFSPEMLLNVNTPQDLERARLIANT